MWALLTPRLLGAAFWVAAMVFTHLGAYQAGRAHVRVAVLEAARRADAQARAHEQALQDQAQRIAYEAEKKRQALEARAAGAARAAGSLRDEIARLNARPAPEDPESAAYAGEARAARQLLGACTAEYRSVAKAADDLRDQVMGLQDYAAQVCKN